jgi:hypothetical protein
MDIRRMGWVGIDMSSMKCYEILECLCDWQNCDSYVDYINKDRTMDNVQNFDSYTNKMV